MTLPLQPPGAEQELGSQPADTTLLSHGCAIRHFLLAVLVLPLASCQRAHPAPPLVLQSVDGHTPPTTMFYDAGVNQSQLVGGSLQRALGSAVIYTWQYRVLYPDGRADTLEPGADTFSARPFADSLILTRTLPRGTDNWQSWVDTAFLRFDGTQASLALLVRLDSGSVAHTLVFGPP